MADTRIEEFAKILVEEVRDSAIQGCDIRFRPNARSPVALRWKALTQQGSLTELAKVLIPDVVDLVVFELLRAIDEGQLKLSFTASNGEKVELTEEGLGELGGWYMGSPGWRMEYSKERYIDDFSHLRGWFTEGKRFLKPE